ncbi:Peroxiredoxin [Mycena indigotica]|uniref:Peroxiredoxin n=1 Tax=Mycena indigotica TaxID=2126181 RepID=A0A8H6S1L7_9AGAR|nr:Peroxiredoxin [Mycena indigotica]KAF7290550.1 Peroxiredoxin [Mycena indigotica]
MMRPLLAVVSRSARLAAPGVHNVHRLARLPISPRPVQALRAVTSVASSIGHGDASTVVPGDKLSATATVKELKADAPAPFDFPAGRHIIVGVPGAFTGTCSAQIPGYINAFDTFKTRGIEQIAVVAVNDVFVLKAWKESLAPEGTPIRFIADDTGAFSKSLGLLFDASPLLGSVRAKRFVIIAKGDTVETVAVENVPSELTVTDAKTILAQLA